MKIRYYTKKKNGNYFYLLRLFRWFVWMHFKQIAIDFVLFRLSFCSSVFIAYKLNCEFHSLVCFKLILSFFLWLFDIVFRVSFVSRPHLHCVMSQTVTWSLISLCLHRQNGFSFNWVLVVLIFVDDYCCRNLIFWWIRKKSDITFNPNQIANKAVPDGDGKIPKSRKKIVFTFSL